MNIFQKFECILENCFITILEVEMEALVNPDFKIHHSGIIQILERITFTNFLWHYLRLMDSNEKRRKGPSEWTGGLLGSKSLYPLGGTVKARLRLFNEGRTSSIYNVVAAIPGAWESDR